MDDTVQLEDQSGAEMAEAPSGDGATPEERLKLREQQVSILDKKLAHLRSWMASVQTQMAATNPQLAKNARRLYIGGVPTGTTEVRNSIRSGRPVPQAQSVGQLSPHCYTHPAIDTCILRLHTAATEPGLPAVVFGHGSCSMAGALRALFLHSLTQTATQEELYQFFAGLMNTCGAAAEPGAAIGSCKITSDKVSSASHH